MPLTKARIIESIQNELDIPKNKSTEIVDSFLGLMKSTLESGDDVLISGFGKFCIKEKNERRGRNPATGNKMMLKPRRVVTFKCSGKLRNAINGKKIKSVYARPIKRSILWRTSLKSSKIKKVNTGSGLEPQMDAMYFPGKGINSGRVY